MRGFAFPVLFVGDKQRPADKASLTGHGGRNMPPKIDRRISVSERKIMCNIVDILSRVGEQDLANDLDEAIDELEVDEDTWLNHGR
jgi:hypothetical protein